MESFRGAEILIFKAETDRLPDPYVDELEKCGFRPKLVPVITFQFFDLHTLKEKLDSPEKYCGTYKFKVVCCFSLFCLCF